MDLRGCGWVPCKEDVQGGVGRSMAASLVSVSTYLDYCSKGVPLSTSCPGPLRPLRSLRTTCIICHVMACCVMCNERGGGWGGGKERSCWDWGVEVRFLLNTLLLILLVFVLVLVLALVLRVQFSTPTDTG